MNDEYFYVDGYGDICSTDDPTDRIDYDELAEYIVENDDDYGIDEIRAILDGDIELVSDATSFEWTKEN